MKLISDDYLVQQQTLHRERDDYGVASLQYGQLVSEILMTHGFSTFVDYGCGKGRLAHGLRIPSDYPHVVTGQLYDPAVPRFAKLPEPAELVVCIDVLEHVERGNLDAVLDHIRELAKRLVFLTIHCGPAAKTLPDGRNAHVTQLPVRTWLTEYLLPRFDLIEASTEGATFMFIGVPYEHQ